MSKASERIWRISWPVARFRAMGLVAACPLFFLLLSSANAASPEAPVKPNLDNVRSCEEYFDKIKSISASGTSYSPQEQYTIDALCEARPADLWAHFIDVAVAGGTAQIDPAGSSTRTLDAKFVKTVVESNQFGAPGYERISIIGAIIEGDLNLSEIRVNNAIELKYIQFRGTIDFSYSSTEHNLEISGVESHGLCLRNFKSTASLLIDHYSQLDRQSNGKSTPFCSDILASPSIGLQGAHIGGELRIRNAAVESVDAEGAQIVEQVVIQDSAISRIVDFSSASTGGLFLWQVKIPNSVRESRSCEESTVYLAGINVSGSAEFVRSDLCRIVMTGARVSRDVSFIGSTLGSFDFTGSSAEGDLQIGPSVSGRLPVWLPPSNNRPNLVLSHSSVAVVRVAKNNWPSMCNMGIDTKEPPADFTLTDGCWHPLGYRVRPCNESRASLRFLPEPRYLPRPLQQLIFGYTGDIDDSLRVIVSEFRFRGFGQPFYCVYENSDYNGLPRLLDYIPLDDGYDIVSSVDVIEDWLRLTRYSPAEYQLFYKQFWDNGQITEAKRIGYVGKLIETRLDYESGSWSAFLTNTLSRGIIGYGYFPYRSIFWVFLFCALGAYLFTTVAPNLIRVNGGRVLFENESGFRKYWVGNFRVLKEYKDFGRINPIGYSFDMLLPIVRLRELHYQIDIGGWQRAYFYIHKIIGWILGIFVLAAFSGLITK